MLLWLNYGLRDFLMVSLPTLPSTNCNSNGSSSMHSVGVPAYQVITVGGAISALEEATQWQQTLKLLARLRASFGTWITEHWNCAVEKPSACLSHNLVGALEHCNYFSIQFGNHHPNWLSYFFNMFIPTEWENHPNWMGRIITDQNIYFSEG